MRYYIVAYDYENGDDYIYCHQSELGGIDEYAVTDGVRIDSWKNIVLRYSSKEEDVLSDHLANVHGWPVVSAKFRELTNAFLAEQVQYLPIKVLDVEHGKEIDTYYVVNAVCLIDALDLEHSTYDDITLDDEKVLIVEKYALNRSKIKGEHMFRLKGDTIPLFVSEEVKDVIEDNALTGFTFIEVELV
ncbi:MAG: hypothetical protein K2P45_04515 [Eubacterium sp.]|nr:hypothetical protein [Eubacterium sp.]